VIIMSGGITNLIKFRTLDNTFKYYWKDRESDVDYPRTYIGMKTPSQFKWTKMEHYLTITEQAFLNNNQKIITVGTREITAREFLIEIASTSMWLFDRPMVE
jgi:hypothetical protein